MPEASFLKLFLPYSAAVNASAIKYGNMKTLAGVVGMKTHSPVVHQEAKAKT